MNPHQWSFAKQSGFQIENIDPKVPKQAEAKRDGVKKPTDHLKSMALENYWMGYLFIMNMWVK